MVFSNGSKPCETASQLGKTIDRTRVISPHNFIQDEGFIMSLKRISDFKLKKILIIGSGNSAFISAQMLLNGPQIQFIENDDKPAVTNKTTTTEKCDDPLAKTQQQ